jgi:hypothetical protein
MGDTQQGLALSANLKKAVCWISETVRDHPEKKRATVIREAGIRFDLTPRECEFLKTKFSEIPPHCGS